MNNDLLLVKVTANTATSEWGDCVYECGSSIHLPYIRFLKIHLPLIIRFLKNLWNLFASIFNRWDLSSLAEVWSNGSHPTDWVRITNAAGLKIPDSYLFFWIILSEIQISILSLYLHRWIQRPSSAQPAGHSGCPSQGHSFAFLNLVSLSVRQLF